MDKKTIIGIIISLIIVLSVATHFIYENVKKNEILDNYEITVGKIYDYNRIGAEGAEYLYYEYTVKGERYTRYIPMTTNKYQDCYKNLDSCKKKLFWVIYSPDNPSHSLINIRHEIQNDTNPIFNLNDQILFE